MGDEGEYWRDVKAHYKKINEKHDNAVDKRGLKVMEDSIEKEGLTVEEDLSNILKPRWRIYNDNGNWIDFWPHTGTFYQPQSKIRENEYDWKDVGKTAAKLLSKKSPTTQTQMR